MWQWEALFLYFQISYHRDKMVRLLTSWSQFLIPLTENVKSTFAALVSIVCSYKDIVFLLKCLSLTCISEAVVIMLKNNFT